MAQRTSQSKAGLNQGGQPKRNYCVVEYDFAKDGGAVGTINLRGDTIPNGARVDQATIVTETALTSGGAATGALQVEAAGDVQAATVVTGSPWTAGTRKKLTADGAGITTTADRTVALVVATAALTAGKFKALIGYWMLA